MCFHASAFNVDISKLSAAEVTSMCNTFNDVTSFNAELSKCNAAKVAQMGGLFILLGYLIVILVTGKLLVLPL